MNVGLLKTVLKLEFSITMVIVHSFCYVCAWSLFNVAVCEFVKINKIQA